MPQYRQKKPRIEAGFHSPQFWYAGYGTTTPVPSMMAFASAINESASSSSIWPLDCGRALRRPQAFDDELLEAQDGGLPIGRKTGGYGELSA